MQSFAAQMPEMTIPERRIAAVQTIYFILIKQRFPISRIFYFLTFSDSVYFNFAGVDTNFAMLFMQGQGLVYLNKFGR